MPRNLSGVIKGKRHTYTIDVTFVRPSDPHRIELSRTWKITARDENGRVAKAQQFRLQDGQSDLLLDDFVAVFKKEAETDFGQGT